MSISSDTARAQVTLTSTDQTINSGFYVFLETDVKVIKTNPTTLVDTVLTLNTHYTVANEGTEVPAFVTMINGTIGDIITVVRNQPFAQPLNLNPLGAFPSTGLEQSIDRIAMHAQVARLQSERALRFPVTDATAAGLELNKAARKSKLVGFDGNGAVQLYNPEDGLFLTGDDVEVGSVTTLRNLSLATVTAAKRIVLTGYYARGDFGQPRIGYWDSASVLVDDNYLSFAISGVATGRIRFAFDGTANVRHAGAKGDGVTDDTIAFNSAVLATTDATDVEVFVPDGAYIVTVGSLTIGTRRIVWRLDNGATVGGDLIQSRPDSTLLPGVTRWGGDVWRLKQTTSAVPVQIIKDNAPLNFFGDPSAFIIQHRDSVNYASGGAGDSTIFAFTADGDGAVISFGGDSWATDSFSRGLRVQMNKTKGGTGHCITLNGSVGAVGAIGAYNELGGVSGFLRNLGSTNGYLSGVEIRVSDSENSSGLNARDTRMIGVLGGVEKFKASATRISHAIYAQSSGNQNVDTAFKADGLFRDGVHFADSPIARWSLFMRGDGRIGWQRSSDGNQDVANCNRLLQLSDRLVVQIGANTSTYGFEIRDSIGNVNFEHTSSDGRTKMFLVTATNGFRIANSNPPATAASAGTTGDIAWDSGFIYVCVATNTWKRTAIATW